MNNQSNTETVRNTNPATGKPKRSIVFPLVLLLLVIGGSWFGITKYNHGKHHEETDDAQVESNISPVIPRISGYAQEVKVKDNQVVKKGDTLLILDTR
ncbi:MAG TPA: biotin/lipoyl-binding protein, partial [Segetibacter sp.]